jgi:hypothetical protein
MIRTGSAAVARLRKRVPGVELVRSFEDGVAAAKDWRNSGSLLP